jgi:hypothetical protein
MAQVTIEIPDKLHDWLEAEARGRRATVDEVVKLIIQERRGSVALSHQEAYILKLFHNVSTKPGWPVPTRMLWTNWGVRGSAVELTSALEGLARKGLIEVAANGFGYTLTDAGFVFHPD